MGVCKLKRCLCLKRTHTQFFNYMWRRFAQFSGIKGKINFSLLNVYEATLYCNNIIVIIFFFRIFVQSLNVIYMVFVFSVILSLKYDFS